MTTQLNDPYPPTLWSDDYDFNPPIQVDARNEVVSWEPNYGLAQFWLPLPDGSELEVR